MPRTLRDILHHQIQCELAEARVAGSTVRGYVRKRKTAFGLASQLVDLATERSEVFEWMRAVQQGAIPRAELKKQLGHVLELDKLLRAHARVLLPSARRR